MKSSKKEGGWDVAQLAEWITLWPKRDSDQAVGKDCSQLVLAPFPQFPVQHLVFPCCKAFVLLPVPPPPSGLYKSLQRPVPPITSTPTPIKFLIE